jgi:amino acid adenylation domain-containing protein
MDNLTDRLSRLSPEKRAWLEAKLQKRKGLFAIPAIPRRANHVSAPLSFSQQRLWFLDLIEGERTAYNMSSATRLRGILEVEALRRAMEEVVRRHEPLRTTFSMIDGDPVQIIQPMEHFDLPVVDLGSTDAEQQKIEIAQRCRKEAEKPFDLTSHRMLRASLLRLSKDENVLLLTMHHIASDGWSFRILWRELGILYKAYRGGKESNILELPVQYADYAIWQRSQLDGPRREQLLQYWRQQLDGVSVLELPTDHPRPTLPTYRGAQHHFELPEDLVAQLKVLSQTSGVTLHMTMLAAFQTLLSRYSGQYDIAVGVPDAGRNQTELEDLIGFFVNTLVLRTDLSGDPTFQKMLGRVRQVSLGAYDHQDLPFEKLVEELKPDRQLNRNPLVQVLFQLLNFPDAQLDLDQLQVSRLPTSSQRVRFDLEMHIWQRSKTLSGSIVYSTDLFDSATIERFVGNFATLLKGIVADPGQRISELPLLTEPERHQLLVEWNNTAVDYPSDRSVHQLFEEQAERIPDAVAVVFSDQNLTYRDLNERANRLAHHLIGLGVEPETLVGLCVERSAELVISILGILKAGGAYVPLGVDYPPQRLEFMLRDSGLKFLVTQRQLVGRLPETDCTMFCLADEDPSFQNLARFNPSARVHAESLAYVMYTSGSTGQPKGVQIPHAAVVNLLCAMAKQPGLTAADRLLSVTTPTFDISVLELLLPLTVGASLEIASSAIVSDPAELSSDLSTCGATVMQATPATWQMLINHGWSGRENLKVLCGGESMPRSIAATLCDRTTPLWNMYGPTETTIWSTIYKVSDVPSCHLIGRPISNTQVYVLDAHRNLVPIGVPGELYIGGVGLSRGYLNRPELTAEKFVQNTFSDKADAKLYRTGDLVRWRADGNLEFLGRIDDQVKLRGFRIELGEIETALNESPDVAQCVVTLREDRPDDKRLVAYYVPAPGTRLNTSQLKSHLQDRLPDYMLPATFVEIEKLPLTSSGKIDRRGLPAPDDSRPDLETGYAIPRNPIEQQLASIWSEVLGIQEIGIHDNFFVLGGHSLLAVRLFASIEKSFGRRLPLAALFQHGTVGHLAELLVELRPETDIATVLSLQPEGDGRPLFMMPTIAGGAMVSRALFECLDGRFPIFGLQLSLAPQNLEQIQDFRTTAGCLVAALRKFQPQGPYALAGFSFGGMMAFEVASQLKEMGEEVDLLAVIDTGPGRRGLDPQWNDRWTRIPRIAVNMPSWLREEVRTFSASQFTERSVRKLRQFFRFFASKGLAKKELDDVFDLGRIPIQNRELTQALYTGFRDYIPRPYSGKLTLIRAQTGPLLSGRSQDLGWSRFASNLDIRHVSGNHETIWHPPHVTELARQLSILMGSIE